MDSGQNLIKRLRNIGEKNIWERIELIKHKINQ